MIEIQNTNKDLLAKLMATEDINVLHKNVPTAYFDVKNRTLVCPILKEDMSPQLYDLFMGHEVGHAINTPADGWHGAVSDKGMVFKRIRARAKGRAGRIIKPTCHIKVTVGS